MGYVYKQIIMAFPTRYHIGTELVETMMIFHMHEYFFFIKKKDKQHKPRKKRTCRDFDQNIPLVTKAYLHQAVYLNTKYKIKIGPSVILVIFSLLT